MQWHLHIRLDDGPYPIFFVAITYDNYIDIAEFEIWLKMSDINATITQHPKNIVSVWFTSVCEAQQFIEAWS